ncbi:hypothetical protein H6P81_017072 [Aristolochia fimbriata]|uniref:Leucine-rich repeat-containing N-terminal plant-type domain-containing protein n=1 Tax=Aristolochia fimbriata TaxID=158543 RepID=A0AAV7DXB8_ARIFI|nr:hypothetical protein H6P81_017072 [Aristolochia fimbriata]
MDKSHELHRRYCSLLYSYLLLLLSSFLLVLLVVPKLVSGCHEEERQALLNFKQGALRDPANRLSSWGSSSGTKDCCSWAGVGCNNTTRRVVKLDLRNANLDEYGDPLSNSSLGGKIDSSLIHLQYLAYLDLSGNDFGSMNNIAIPEFFGSFEHLEYLNISHANFVGNIPRQLGNLSNLHSRELGSRNQPAFGFQRIAPDQLYVTENSCTNITLLAELNSWLANFSSLTHLYLSFTGFDGSMPPSIGNLTNLEVLDLSENSINGTVPRCLISNLCHLRILRLEGNSIRGMEPLPRCLSDSLEELNLHGNQLGGDLQVLLGEISNSKTLKILDLSFNSLSGYIPPSIGNLTNLEVLDMSGNSINGTIPRSLISNLCHLRILGLGGNSIRGMEPLPRCLSDSLEELNLHGNQLGGDLQVLLGEISNSKTLKILDLSYNSLSGYIPYSSSSSTTGDGRILSYVLEELDLDGNKLSGHVILQNIGKFTNLARLSISDNSLPIVITEDVLSNLQWLEDIDLSNNRLVWKVKSRTWLPPYISRIYLSSSQVGPKFPSWLQHHNAISELNMSNAKISDDVPNWFWKIATGMEDLDLSDNQLRGYLSNNIGMSALYILDISNNSLSGPIPKDFCMHENLARLDLSSNHFHGNIPDCWGKGGRNLFYIDLSNNNLSGDFPRSLGDLPYLAFLHMRNNFLSGEISTITKNMNNLVVLDLAYNRLSSVLPTWGTIGEQLLNLRILSLRSNLIHGDIPSQISQLSSLQFLDLSYNKLSGAIPTSFGNFTAMTRVHNETDEVFEYTTSDYSGAKTKDSVWMNLKGVELENRGSLGFMNHIDLSSNNLSGDVPEELTQLLGLVSLNLSGNSLKGGVPKMIGKLRQLESLDLSKNKLSGEIPSSISNLNFLSKLNLSYNNLSGPIPTGFQLQTLNVDLSIYVGNDNLCGPPLLRKCSTNELPNNGKFGGGEKRGKEDELEIIGLFISIALGFVVGFWGFYGFLIFKRSWRIWYYRFVDEMMDKVYVAFVVRAARLKRKFNKSAEI